MIKNSLFRADHDISSPFWMFSGIWIFPVASWICSKFQSRPGTDSTKINRPGYSIHMYWTNFWQPTVHVKQTIFEKTLIEVCRTHLYASFGTFCVQIGQLFEAHWVFKQSEEFRNRRDFPSMRAICRFSNILQRLTVPHIIDQFQRKRCQKKRKDWGYKVL